MALDPQTKKYVTKVLTHERDRRSLWNDIKDTCIQVARESVNVTVEETVEEHPNMEVLGGRVGNSMPRPGKKSGTASFFPDYSDEEMGVAGAASDGVPSVEDAVSIEISKYQSDSGLKLHEAESYNCPLEWWRVNHTNYPNIWKLAERILAIPATSAPSERVFSSAAKIVDKKRVRLKPYNVDSLVFLKGNEEHVDWEE
eukprot:CAMPEP_0172438218 /NCGR_PEP_ID=MMETSP1064-20121228/72685_1 /TAXON_ID=202472 /ORGANISM="Aulacoseira subarctica , Strain CCAP 1002/5" /LENGTH=198 /DNA_ID=CAMNT_0013186761 /DNA_START=546 /DNA_END=1139 /DNA_ORIENTATION=-